MFRMNPVFYVLSDATRRHLLALLCIEGELCVCELVAALDDIQPKISRHLAVLREAGWVSTRREGTWMFYRLSAIPAWAQLVVEAMVQGGVPAEQLVLSQQRLANFAGRPVRTLEDMA